MTTSKIHMETTYIIRLVLSTILVFLQEFILGFFNLSSSYFNAGGMLGTNFS